MDSRITNYSSMATSGERMAGAARKLGNVKRGSSVGSTTISCRGILLRLARHDQSYSDDVRFEFVDPDNSEEHVRRLGGDGVPDRVLYQTARASVGKEKEGERAF